MTPALNGPVAATELRAPSVLDQIVEETARIGARYMPTLTVKQFSEREKLLRELKELLVQDVDYGTIPGTDKPTLLLPGAQKICTFFGYVPHYEARQIEDWTGADFKEALFYYDFTCTLLKDGKPVGEGRGSCNSWESRYRYRWVSKDVAQKREDFASLPARGGRISEPAFAIEAAQTGGKYGKPMEYWQAFKDAIERGEAAKIKKPKKDGGTMDAWEIDTTLYRIPNDGFPDIINTCQKMGQKRAYIAATLSATGASQYFTQDLEDMGDQIDTGGHPVGTQAAANHVRDQKIAEGEKKPQDSGRDAGGSFPPPERSASFQAPSGVAESTAGAVKSPDNTTDGPGLSALLTRVTSPDTFDVVAGEVIVEIEKHATQAYADESWTLALKKHGDPKKANGKGSITAHNCIRFIYGRLVAVRPAQQESLIPAGVGYGTD